MCVFIPITYILSRKKFPKVKSSERKGLLIKLLDIPAIKKCLIHDYDKREESGELRKLRHIFEKTSFGLETQKTKFDINKKDHELKEKELWLENQGDEFEDPFDAEENVETEESVENEEKVMDENEILG